MQENYWSELLNDVLPGRVAKPRISGLTMVIDTGLPITLMRDILQMASDHIDFWKLGFASASVCPADRIKDKISLCQEYGVLAYPGGTSLEIAIVQDRWQEYVESLWHNGVRVIEVSDGTIVLPLRLRREIIRRCRRIGFTVISEVGKKMQGTFLPISEQAQIIHGDLNSGANYIIVEGREGGQDIGVYDKDGNARDEDVEALLNILGPLSTRLIWEAPLAKQQSYYVRKIGNHVNFGNIKPMDIVGVESIRRGLRSDTLRDALPDQYRSEGNSDSLSLHGAEEGATNDASAPKLSAPDSSIAYFVQPIQRPTLWVAGRSSDASSVPKKRMER